MLSEKDPDIRTSDYDMMHSDTDSDYNMNPSEHQGIYESDYDMYDSEGGLFANSSCFNMYGMLLNDTSNPYVWNAFSNCNNCEFAKNQWYAESNVTDTYCPPKWDRLSCWPPTPAGQTSSIPCMEQLNGLYYDTSMNATLDCYSDATWSNKSDYSNCKQLPMDNNSQAVTMIYFCGHTLSLIAVLIAFSICIYFKEMRCLRNKIHANLFLTYLLANSFWIATYVTQESGLYKNYTGKIIWCSLFVFTKYFHLATFFWMFVEGLYLFVQVIATFSVENSNMKLRHYLLIGWGIPLSIVGVWAFLISSEQQVEAECPFMHSSNSYLEWIYIAPVLILLTTNTFFLLSIFYVVITKLRSTGRGQADHQNWKAAKALLVIIPLLGITYLITIEGPDPNTIAHVIFEHVRAVLLSTQGFTVTLPYCFLNTEVKTIVRNNWARWRANRYIGSRYCRNASARNSISMVGFYGCDSNMTNVCNSRRNSFLRYAQYLSGTNQPANHPPNQPPNQPSDTMYLTNPHQQNHFIPGNHGNHGHYNNHGGFGNHGNNGHNNHQLVTTTALMANRISPLPREEIDLRLMGNITQISITPATPISTSPSKMEFPSPNGFAGETENGEEDGENSSENSSVNGGEIELNHRHPEENDEVPESHNLQKGEPPKRRIESTENSSNSTAAAVVIPVIVSNGGQRFGSNVEQAIITVDTPLLQKEDENVELVSSC